MKVNPSLNASKEENLVTRLWFRYFPFWPVFAVLLVLSVITAWFYLRSSTPLYEASASVLIKDEKKGADESKIAEALNQLSSKKIIENEMEVFKSRVLMLDVVKNLHMYAPVKDKDTGKDAYSTSPLVIEAASTDSLIETKKDVPFSLNEKARLVTINDKVYGLNKWENTPWGRLKFSTRAVDTRSKNFAFAIISPRKLADALAKAIKITSASKLATVINLKIQDPSPRRAEDILNELVVSYNNAAIKDKGVLAANTLASVDERLKVVSLDLDSIQRKLESYKSRTGAVDISSQGQLFLKNVSETDQKLSDINSQLAALNQVEKYVKSKSNGGSIVPSTLGVENTQMVEMLNDLSTTELQYEKMKGTVGSEHPQMKALQDQINKIKPGILDNINSQRRNLEASRQNFYSTNNQYSSVLQTLPQKEKDMIEITREQGIKTNIYNFLLQKKEEAALSLASAASESRTIDKAEATQAPVSPNKKLVYLLSLILAMGIGAGLIAANEIFTQTVLFRQDIEKLTSAPVISEIMFDTSGENIVIGNNKRTFIAEQFRRLRTALTSIGIGGKKKTLLVTSTVGGDGKSFIVANLGLSLAMIDKKVVVLELDLVNPTLSEKLNVNSPRGVTDYLAGTADPEDIIRRTPVHENLFIISAGVLPDDPSELIVKGGISELLEYLKNVFDYIIIDSAPAGLMTDAYTITNYCDATLYVIRHRHTPKRMIKRLDEETNINSLKNVSVIFNGVKSRGFGNPRFGYGYGYGYGYTSGYAYEKQDAGKKRKKMSLAFKR